MGLNFTVSRVVKIVNKIIVPIRAVNSPYGDRQAIIFGVVLQVSSRTYALHAGFSPRHLWIKGSRWCERAVPESLGSSAVCF